jgi:pilus assembly protein CpaF
VTVEPAAPEPELVDRVRARLAAEAEAGAPTPGGLAAALRAEGRVLGDRGLRAELAAVGSELGGLGVLAPLVDDVRVTDVLVTAPDEVWVECDGRLSAAAVRFRDEAGVRALAQRLAAQAGRRLDDAVPFVDARLPGGVRLHAVLAPTSRRGTCLSLRVPARPRPLSLADLVERGAMDAPLALVLRRLVAARVSLLVTGGTGSGKTTVLGALVDVVPPGQRVVVVEESGELAPRHPHAVLLESRPAGVEGTGSISLADLLRQALRMRPDRLVVGEVRGAEIVPLLAALNSGHEGCLATLHANATADAAARVEALALGGGMGREAVHAQLAAGLGAVVHLGRDVGGRRRVREVAALVRAGDDRVRAIAAWTYDGCSSQRGPGAERLEALTESAVVEPGP